MLDDWLGSISRATFVRSYLGRRPVAQPRTVRSPERLLDWHVLQRVLAAPAGPEVLVVARGHLLDLPRPRTLGELAALLRTGIGLCIQHAERGDAGLRRVADAFHAALGAAQVQVFVTPAGTYGFGWHYDDEDVFIAQTSGVKDHYFRPNTVAADRPAHAASFARFADESSPVHTATLLAGDFLYVPARWWHMARCREPALSISVGVLPRRIEPGMVRWDRGTPG